MADYRLQVISAEAMDKLINETPASIPAYIDTKGRLFPPLGDNMTVVQEFSYLVIRVAEPEPEPEPEPDIMESIRNFARSI